MTDIQMANQIPARIGEALQGIAALTSPLMKQGYLILEVAVSQGWATRKGGCGVIVQAL